ncbi:extracellular solute-binding protein [Falsibacillus albus]|uniref:Extracellular solute-binding protein n=1 Tax=Falsibacillus albus TaxID=2478915 RepID=A0A3L7K9W7_9BACI|nr:extracellular solute-binding protein [Falsibacillus albus]RLQ97442.1 extracellular solute-binding protein [Falsibacillus albus]
MKRRLFSMVVVFMIIALLALTGCSNTKSAGNDSDVTITYWQYTFPAKVTEIKSLIKKFEAENPHIKVVAQDFPYDQYNQKVSAAMHAGKGPDILNLYYGWLPQYVKQGYLQPIPQDFMSTADIEKKYIPMIQASKIDDQYYTLPIAVRSLALFWNKELFKKAGLDPDTPPKTWDELIAYAKKLTIRKDNGKLEQEGFAWDVNGQGYHAFEEVLLRQWGIEPFSEDGKEVQWNSDPAGLDAFTYWINMNKKDKIGEPNFLTDYNTAFKAGKAGMIIDGSFDIAAIKEAAKFNWGVATLPVKAEGGLEANFGSFWTNGIAKGVKGERLKAAEKFLDFLTSEETQTDWLKNVGELPASASFANDDSINNDPIYGPFVQGLQHAHATFFVDEAKERDSMSAQIDKILLNNEPIDKTFESLVKEQQQIRDDYFNNQ